MDKLHKKVRQVRRRLLWLRFISVTLTSLCWLSIVAALTLLASRLVMLGESEEIWQQRAWWVIGGLFVAAIPLGVLSLLIRRTSLFQAAVAADDHLSLRERISSAFLLKGPLRPMEQLLEADAVTAAERIRPLRDFPFQPPRQMRWLPIPLIALVLMALFLDQHNLLANEEAPTPQERANIIELQEESEEQAEELEELASTLEDLEAITQNTGEWEEMRKELEEIAEDLRQVSDSRLEQVAELSDLADEVAEQRDALEMQLDMSRHFAADPDAGMTSDIQEAMERGDMEAAQEAVEELMQEIAERAESGDLDAETMEQLAEEIAQMSEQMGGQNSQTGQQMAAAAQAMAAAAEAMAAQQGQQGQEGQQGQQGEQAGGQQAASQQMQAAMAQMQQAMGDLADAQQQLQIAEALEQDLNAMRSELSRSPQSNQRRQQQQQERKPGECSQCGGSNCQGGSCSGSGYSRLTQLSMRTGEWSAGPTEGRSGNGMGGPGQGRGGRAPEGDPNVSFREEHQTTSIGQGVIIAQFRHDDGVQIPGEVSTQVSDVFLSYEQQAEETLETEAVPAGYRNIVGDYFTSIHPVQTAPANEGTD